MILPTIKRGLWIAALWGIPVSAFHTLHQIRTPPHIRTLAELRLPSADRLPQVSDWQGPLPLILGESWTGSISKGQLEVSFTDLEWFAPGSAQITTIGRDTLSEFKRQLEFLPVSSNALRFTVESHTDSSPVIRLKHLFPSNWHLSQARAEAIRFQLKRAGLAPEQIQTLGLADSQPAPQMRRVTFKLTFPPPGNSWTQGRMEVAQQ